MDSNLKPTNLEKPLQVLHIIWIAFFLSFGGFLLISELTKSDDADVVGFTDPFNLSFTLIMFALGISTVALSFFVKSVLLRKSLVTRRAETVLQAYIIAFVMSESAFLFGLVLRFIVQTKYHYVLFALASVALVLRKPRREHLYEATFGKTI
jgi:F0F1-type ATP synthase membrane subunit c/vacuolar-type H+-ATPase subunit K